MDLFKKRRMYFFRKSVKTKDEYPTTFIFQNVLEKMVEKKLVNGIESINDKMYRELATLYHSKEEEEWRPFKETKSTLQKILEFRDIKIAVLSNHPHHSSIKNMLREHDLLKFFDTVVTSAKFGKRKPNPEIFHHTLEKMGLDSEDANYCLMCGDEYADIVGGNRVGLKTILFERDFEFPFEKEMESSNLNKINNISEILNFIN